MIIHAFDCFSYPLFEIIVKAQNNTTLSVWLSYVYETQNLQISPRKLVLSSHHVYKQFLSILDWNYFSLFSFIVLLHIK